MGKQLGSLDRLLKTNKKGPYSKGQKAQGKANKAKLPVKVGKSVPPEMRGVSAVSAVLEVEELPAELPLEIEPESVPLAEELETVEAFEEVESVTADQATAVQVVPPPVPSPAVQTKVAPRTLGPLPRATVSNDGDIGVADAQIPGIISLVLPQLIRAKYAAAKEPHVPLRQYLADRLVKCQNHSDDKYLYLGEAIVRKIEQLAHRDFGSGEELLGWLLTSSSVRVGHMDLDVEPELMDRVEARMGPDQTLAEALSEYLTYGIEVKTGMR